MHDEKRPHTGRGELTFLEVFIVLCNAESDLMNKINKNVFAFCIVLM